MSRQKRYLIFVGILLLAFGTIVFVKKRSPSDYPIPVPTKIVELAKKRLPLLRADMNSEQIIATLGLSNYCWMAEGGGPRSHFWTTFDMGNGHHLYLVSSISPKSEGMPSKSTRLSVSVDSETWKPQNDSTNQRPNTALEPTATAP
jgi:hypothetical protein